MPELRLRDRILHATAGWHTTTDPSCVEYKPTRANTLLDRMGRGVACQPCLEARYNENPPRGIVCPECDERIPVPIHVELVRDEYDDEDRLIATPDMTDVWAHAWTHNGGNDE